MSPSDGIKKKKKKSSLRLLRDIILDVSFCVISTESPGLFVAHVPVILNGNREMPYRTLTLRGELLAPSLTFYPDSIRLMPVPLSTKVSVNFNITARGYRRYSTHRIIIQFVFFSYSYSFFLIVSSTYCCNFSAKGATSL